MRARVLVAVVGLPLLVALFLLAPDWVLALFLALLSAIAAWEMMKCVNCPALLPAAVAGAVCRVFAAAWPGAFFDGLVLLLALTVFFQAVQAAGRVKLLQVLSALFAMVAIPYGFTAFLRLAPLGRGFLMLPLLFSFGSDTCAFFAGRAFGKHKLTPISPHKTVEGAAGGLVGDVVLGLIFALVMNLCWKVGVSYLGAALLGAFCSVVSQVGDLTFSLIKREFNVKDYGKILPGHGGILDRFDSVLFVAPVLAAMTSLL